MKIMNIYKILPNLKPWYGEVLANLSGFKIRLFRLTTDQKRDEFELHPEVDESLILLSGKVIVHTSLGEITLVAGDSIVIERGTYHKLEALEESTGIVSRFMP